MININKFFNNRLAKEKSDKGDECLKHYREPFVQDAGNCGIYAALNGFKMLSDQDASSINLKDDILKLVKKVSYFPNNENGITFIGEFFDGDNLCKLINNENFKKLVRCLFIDIDSFCAENINLTNEIFEKSSSNEFYIIPIHLNIKSDNIHWITVYEGMRANSINGDQRITHKPEYLDPKKIKEENSKIKEKFNWKEYSPSTKKYKEFFDKYKDDFFEKDFIAQNNGEEYRNVKGKCIKVTVKNN